MIYIFDNKNLKYKNITYEMCAAFILVITITFILTLSFIKGGKTIPKIIPVNSEVLKSNSYHIVTASCYRPTIGQCDSTPLITADGSKIDTNNIDNLRWLAISRNLEKHYKMGDKILVAGVGNGLDGIWIIKDRMNKRFKNKIDFLISDKITGGLFKNIKIYKIL